MVKELDISLRDKQALHQPFPLFTILTSKVCKICASARRSWTHERRLEGAHGRSSATSVPDRHKLLSAFTTWITWMNPNHEAVKHEQIRYDTLHCFLGGNLSWAQWFCISQLALHDNPSLMKLSGCSLERMDSELSWLRLSCILSHRFLVFYIYRKLFVNVQYGHKAQSLQVWCW